MQKVAILGSTGSIGTQALDVIDQFPQDFLVLALSAKSRVELLAEQCRKYHPEYIVLMDEVHASRFKDLVEEENSPEILIGHSALSEVAGHPDVDIVVNGLVGAVGLRPSIAALQAGKTLALANKESLVIGGELLTEITGAKESMIIPVDSEHSALFMLLHRRPPETVKKLILTASGGPFRELPSGDLETVSVEDALRHPNWDMGSKITIDSATLMNKGLEVIEAHWLFALPYEQIKVVVHPQSVIHAMIELIDNSIYAELSVPDMRLSIQHALLFPEIRENRSLKHLDLIKLGSLSFEEPRWDDFPCLKLAYQAGREGGFFPCVLNAANEVAVDRFLQQRIRFTQIPELIERVINQFDRRAKMSLDALLEVDAWARRQALEEVQNL